MKVVIHYIIAISICMLAMMLTGASQPVNDPVIVNLMVNPDTSGPITKVQLDSTETNLRNMYNDIGKRNLTVTMFLTQDVTSSKVAMFLAHLGLFTDYEFAISSRHSNETLSSISYSEQKAILEGSKKSAEGSRVCGRNEITIKGFKPQSSDQNEDTFKSLDALRMKYDAGFQAGVQYIPGHEVDVWPYQVKGHNFYAVPISTYNLSGQKVPLQDRYFKDNGFDSSQWYDALLGKFGEAQINGDPMIIDLTTSISFTGDYLGALQQFLDYAVSKNARFVTTMDLVNMSITGIYEAPAASIATAMQLNESKDNSSENVSSGCSECDAKNNASMNATEQNKTTIFVDVS